jgi:hypothetical protein
MRLRSTAISITTLVLVGALAFVSGRPPALAQNDQAPVSRTAAIEVYEPDSNRRLSPELIEACLEVAAQVDPSMADRLRSICDVDPDAFELVMQRSGQRVLGLARIREEDPELYESKINELRIEARVNRVARQMRDLRRQGDVPAADQLETQLRGLLRIQVALSIKARGDSIRRLEEHLGALREQLARQVDEFDDIVERQMEDLSSPDAPVRHPLLVDDVPQDLQQ